MSARIKASERFAIVDEYQNGDIFVDLRCPKTDRLDGRLYLFDDGGLCSLSLHAHEIID
jgi:hypothetical protein